MLSMNLTLRGKSVLVVGAGKVGQRKAETVLAAGAVVTVIDPRPLASLFPDTGYRQEAFTPAHLDGMRLAFACATPVVNAEVVTAAKARGVWVCSATDPAAGDFVLPSVVRRGDLTFAVSTGGASPALAKRIAAELLEQFDDSYTDWVRVLGEVRRVVLTEVADPTVRRSFLESLADPAWLARIRTAGADVTLAEMLRRVRPGTV
jgi:precorrin-2 dehydrogenase/sirohydrochlorin ferrochelatase